MKNSTIQFQKAMKRIFLLNRHHKNKKGDIGEMIFELQSMQKLYSQKTNNLTEQVLKYFDVNNVLNQEMLEDLDQKVEGIKQSVEQDNDRLDEIEEYLKTKVDF